MQQDALSSEHWLLSYEALRKGWLPSLSGVDYTSSDSFFAILRKHDVEFYDQTGIAGQIVSGYHE